MAMRSPTIVSLLALLAVVASGCGSDAPPATEDPTASAPASAPADGAAPDTANPEPFESPTVDAEEVPSPPAAGLIGSTNSKERAIQVQRSIQASQKNNRNTDPFGALPVEATPNLPEGSLTAAAADNEAGEQDAAPPLPPLTAQSGESTPDLPFPIIPVVSAIPPMPMLEIAPQGRSPAPAPTQGRSPAPAPTQGRSPTPAPSPIPTPTSTPPVSNEPPTMQELEPPPPSTALAESIEVLGVVQVGREVQVLIRTPESPIGRYVAVGETVANGQVQIRRVERLQGGGEPVVILVQNDIEVARRVGDLPDASDGETVASQSNRPARPSSRSNMGGTGETVASRLPLPVPSLP